MLNVVFDITTKIIQHYEGVVDKFIGDAEMAVFNAPNEVKKHQAKACTAAVETVCAIEGLQRVWKQLGLSVPIRVRTGINTGRVMVGTQGSEDRFSYSVIGTYKARPAAASGAGLKMAVRPKLDEISCLANHCV